jgi:hypothetical protein
VCNLKNIFGSNYPASKIFFTQKGNLVGRKGHETHLKLTLDAVEHYFDNIMLTPKRHRPSNRKKGHQRMDGERERLRNLTLSTSQVWIIPERFVSACKVCTSQWLIIIYVVCMYS